jgi:hypothetical protein
MWQNKFITTLSCGKRHGLIGKQQSPLHHLQGALSLFPATDNYQPATEYYRNELISITKR